jgi:2-iminoacetate synthase ThiH
MLEFGEDFNFMPWEVEQCPHMAKATAMPPTPISEIERAIANMRLYLRKMHGADRARFVLGG